MVRATLARRITRQPQRRQHLRRSTPGRAMRRARTTSRRRAARRGWALLLLLAAGGCGVEKAARRRWDGQSSPGGRPIGQARARRGPSPRARGHGTDGDGQLGERARGRGDFSAGRAAAVRARLHQLERHHAPRAPAPARHARHWPRPARRAADRTRLAHSELAAHRVRNTGVVLAIAPGEGPARGKLGRSSRRSTPSAAGPTRGCRRRCTSRSRGSGASGRVVGLVATRLTSAPQPSANRAPVVRGAVVNKRSN